MWSAHLQLLGHQVIKITIDENRQPLSRRAVVERWSECADFRAWFTATLSGCPFDAYFWETPPLTKITLDLPFESVVMQAAPLREVHADPTAFDQQFAANPIESILSFPNLGGDAQLIVPSPRANNACYAHLAFFLRHAPRSQTSDFWERLGQELRRRSLAKPVWVSTAGLGIPWLHLRLDSRPKYYRHTPYRVMG